MPKIHYQAIRLQATALDMVRKVNRIIEDYLSQGFRLTLRQIYYQLVAHDLFPHDRKWTWTGTRWERDSNGTKNAEPNYKWLGGIVNDGRLAGLIDWDAIEDRTRELREKSNWATPADIVATCARQFHVDLWEGQEYRPEVWIEKDALIGVIEGVCNELDVPYFSCRGYTSQSEMWSGAMRLQQHVENGLTPVIFHFGDHDPSGKDMTRDIEERMQMFMGGIELQRLALNMNQVEKYNPPPNPAKLTDSRCRAYIAEFGSESWELDALEPRVIAALIRTNVMRLADKSKFDARIEERTEGRKYLTLISDNWQSVERFLKRKRT